MKTDYERKKCTNLNEKASNILKLAVLEARIQHSETVDVHHLLLAILHDQVDNGAKQVLELNNMNYEDTFTYLHQANPVHSWWVSPSVEGK